MNLKGLPSILRISAQTLDVSRVSISDADLLELTERIGKLHADVDRLKVYADEVRTGWILRVKL